MTPDRSLLWRMVARIKVGDFPPDLASSDTLVGALLGALIISVVSTLASIALTPRKLL